ncbi:MAG: transcriptional repressor [Acutalibacteraceae bacterium]|nr:transcriptional repressor [Acutalibacteraceae bacterium]
MKKYSRQREAILNVLYSTDTHPTANWVYDRVRETIPNISLGTVYRNLASLSEAGEILSLQVGDGYEHFDGNNSLHAHFCCRRCSRIIDIMLENDYLSEVAQKNGFTPDSSVYIVRGVCCECNSKEKN